MVRRASPRTMYGFSDGVRHLNRPLRLVMRRRSAIAPYQPRLLRPSTTHVFACPGSGSQTWSRISDGKPRRDRKSTRLNSSHTVIYTLSLHDALPICPIPATTVAAFHYPCLCLPRFWFTDMVAHQ